MNKITLIICCALFAACGAPRGGRMLALEDTDARGWDRTALQIVVEDTLLLRELSVYLRYDGTLSSDSLPLRIYIQAPGGEWAEDNITAYIDREGNGIREIVIPYRNNVVFPRKGIYTFNISTPRVHGIRAVGITDNGQG